MANIPFDRNVGLLAALGAEPRRRSLLDYLTSPTPPPEASPKARSLVDLLTEKSTQALPVSSPPHASGLGNVFGILAPATPAHPSFNALASLLAPPPPSFPPHSPPTRAFGSLTDLIVPPAPPFFSAYAPRPKPKPVAPETKRNAFFSFHNDDIMRVNNVRNAWKISHPDSSLNRSFYDSSLWEARKIETPDGIKQLIRAGVLRTSAVCVLAGTMTWHRRWVRYEIARAIIDGRGVLTVHLNSINHHQTKGPHPRGLNPLAHMGVAKLQLNERSLPHYYLCEMNLASESYGGVIERWIRYGDYTFPVKKPGWLTDPNVGEVMPLSLDAAEYDYEQHSGHRNIGSWIDKAAKQADRSLGPIASP